MEIAAAIVVATVLGLQLMMLNSRIKKVAEELRLIRELLGRKGSNTSLM
jgi:hypothetical protein